MEHAVDGEPVHRRGPVRPSEWGWYMEVSWKWLGSVVEVDFSKGGSSSQSGLWHVLVALYHKVNLTCSRRKAWVRVGMSTEPHCAALLPRSCT
eukprot:CAMPEP_0119374770 /NCGR_PEP_ID=MMETSP1334-20130426/32745_1 /TAXON_ID=127549 /ORGANISM="Calcidiscus leptoporus, Strain RCC1130" /LENGTH=92 /DNA_ID=CAMNT_0007392919 /DNA_START=73 /DNA_END=351 /DNA_ORIENTATION=-